MRPHPIGAPVPAGHFRVSSDRKRGWRHVAAALSLGALAVTAACRGDEVVGNDEPAVPRALTSASTVRLSPGANIQTAVNNNPTGTTFSLAAGTYLYQTVTPKDGDVFVGDAGAILNGGDRAITAFTGTAKNVTIRNLIIEHYKPGAQKPAVAADATTNWLIQGNEFRYNDGMGVHTGKNTRVLNNNFHHNAQLGLGGQGDSVLVQGNEIAYNNYEKKYDYHSEAGGLKLVRTRWLTIRNNYAHDNWGRGLWCDLDCWRTTIDSNRVVHNAGTGIFYEISYYGVIRGNTAEGNGYNDSWLEGSGIELNTSTDVQIYGNTIKGNKNGIIGLEAVRGSGAYGTRLLRLMSVHDNVVDVSAGGATGIGTYSTTSTASFSTTSNRWFHNTYLLGKTNLKPFAWKAGNVSETSWRALPQDATTTGSTFTR
jgi:parallel beta-helix repeat protein